MSDNFISIPLISLKDCFKDLPLDVYLNLGEGRYVKAFEKTTGLDFARLAHYEAKGVTQFYIDKSQKHVLDDYFSRSPLMALASPSATPEVKRKAIWAVMEQTLFECFAQTKLTGVNVDRAYQALKGSLERDGEFLKIITMLLRVAPKDDLFFRHAISTAVYSYMIAMLTGQKSLRSLKIVLFASFFHDMGRAKLPETRRISSQNHTPEEIAEFRTHPNLTVEMFQEPLPFADEEVRRCILQHKERLDGKGYPNQLRGVSIYGLAKVLAIADGFSELTLGLEDGNIYSQAQSIATMRSDTGHYDNSLLLPFAEVVLSRQNNKAA